MLDQPEFNGGFSLLKCRLGGVLSRNPFPGLRGGGHDCLPFGWLALLQLTETADPTEQAIQLINRDRFFEFRTGSVEQRLLAPRADDRRDRRVSVRFALLVEGRAFDRDDGNPDSAKDDDGEED